MKKFLLLVCVALVAALIVGAIARSWRDNNPQADAVHVPEWHASDMRQSFFTAAGITFGVILVVGGIGISIASHSGGSSSGYSGGSSSTGLPVCPKCYEKYKIFWSNTSGTDWQCTSCGHHFNDSRFPR